MTREQFLDFAKRIEEILDQFPKGLTQVYIGDNYYSISRPGFDLSSYRGDRSLREELDDDGFEVIDL